MDVVFDSWLTITKTLLKRFCIQLDTELSHTSTCIDNIYNKLVVNQKLENILMTFYKCWKKIIYLILINFKIKKYFLTVIFY